MQVICIDNTNTVLTQHRIYDVYKVFENYYTVIMQDRSLQCINKLNVKELKEKQNG